MIRARISGGEKVQANLRAFQKNFKRALARTVKKQMQRVLDRAQNEFVPVDTAALRESGRVVMSGKGYSASVTFGGGECAPYALAVHEHLSEHSPESWINAEMSGRGVHFNPAGRGPKYLERPWLEESRRMLQAMGEDLNVDRTGL